MHPNDAAHLQEWANAAEVAERLGVTRQTVNRLYWTEAFETLHRMGTVNSRTFVVKRSELEQYAKDREVRISERPAARG